MRILKTFLSILFLFFMMNLSLIAATGTVNAFKFNEFLPSSYVSTMAQDQDNRIWFATSDWVSSFDGYNMKSLKKPERIANSRPVINKLHFDKAGNLWIATLEGAYCYDPQTAQTSFLLFNTSDILHKSNIIYDIVSDKDGRLFFGTRNGIYLLANKEASPIRLTSFAYHETFNEKTKSERIARCLLFDKQGYLWVGTEGNGLLRINLRDNSTERFSKEAKASGLPSDFIESLHEDILGMIWIGTTDGVMMFDPAKSSLERIRLNDNPVPVTISSISSDTRGNVFIGTNIGLYLYERNSKRISSFVNNPQDNNSLCSNTVKYLFKDRSDAMWICTQRGVSLFEESPEFNLYQNVFDNPSSLINNQIQFLIADSVRNLLYTGTKQMGLSVFNPDKHTFKNLVWNNDSQLQQKHKAMLCGFMNSKNELLIGTEGGILKYTPEKGLHPFEYDDLITFPRKDIYAILEDKAGNYYLSILDKGLYYLNIGNGKFTKVNLVDEDVHKDIYTNIKVLHLDFKGRLWVVFRQGGLACYDPFTGNSIHYHKEDFPQLKNNTIWSLLETSSRKLLIGTISGITVFDLEKDDFTTGRLFNGTRNHVIFGMLEDKKNDALWVATDNGVFRYKHKSGDLILFSERDNLQGMTFNYQSSVILSNRLYFAGDNGLNETNLNVKIENYYPAEPRIVGIRKNGYPMVLNDIRRREQTLQLKIEKGESIELDVSAFSYQKMWRNNYRYKIEGIDSTWHYLLKGANKIVLSDLPRGSYKLIVAASNSAGNWSPPLITAQIHVSFSRISKILMLLTVSLIGGILIVVVFFRLKRVHLQTETEPVKIRNIVQTEDSLHTAETVLETPDERVQVLLSRLDEIMEKEEPYLNKRFSKTQLAGMMRITEPQLSQLLKEYRGKCYTDYINEYRVEYFKKMIANESFKDYTLLSIGIECGFNSKTSFYRVFKSFTGYTPSEYIEQMKTTCQR